jgi:hypothetical protein
MPASGRRFGLCGLSGVLGPRGLDESEHQPPLRTAEIIEPDDAASAPPLRGASSAGLYEYLPARH